MNDELYHFGVKGMKWGVRRYQNKDGSLTPAGKKRNVKSSSTSDDAKEARKANMKKAAIAGAAVAGTALAVYGGYKFNKWVNSQNAKLANNVGMSFADRFSNQIAPKTRSGPNPSMRNLRYNNRQRFSKVAGEELGKMVSNEIGNQRGIKRVKRAFDEKSIERGKKTAFDVVDYNQTVSKIIKDTDALHTGQSVFAKALRDTIHNGGSLPREFIK